MGGKESKQFPISYEEAVKRGNQKGSVGDPDPELFPGSGIICSGFSKSERADKLKIYF